jgi:polyribonucleotide nucleotidyltransferase
MLGAVMFGHKGFQPVIDAIIKLAEVAAKEPRDFTPPTYEELEAEMLKLVEGELRAKPTRTPRRPSAMPPSTP